ncbi:hypothetical protein E4O93_09070 [Diaphorobacter sp. DS2]|nr:hypothetical protein E4O93_09070 [Diaphorobacter sp. DS2]
MKYYEATNGFMGYSYVRCNVYANDEEEALELAREAFKSTDDARIIGEGYYRNIELELLLDTDADKEPFYTYVTD